MSTHPPITSAIRILLVEDKPADAELATEALAESKLINELDHVEDGVEAMKYLRGEGAYAGRALPDLLLLDLNLPRMDGREVLAAIKSDEELRRIPVVILTTSESEEDILRSYDLHANCYITKPIDLNQFVRVVRAVEDFWITIVRLPPAQSAP